MPANILDFGSIPTILLMNFKVAVDKLLLFLFIEALLSIHLITNFMGFGQLRYLQIM